MGPWLVALTVLWAADALYDANPDALDDLWVTDAMRSQTPDALCGKAKRQKPDAAKRHSQTPDALCGKAKRQKPGAEKRQEQAPDALCGEAKRQKPGTEKRQEQAPDALCGEANQQKSDAEKRQEQAPDALHEQAKSTKKKATQKIRLCKHSVIKWSTSDDSIYFLDGICQGNYTDGLDQQKQCTQKNCVACIVCPSNIRSPKSDKTWRTLIGGTPSDKPRAVKTHENCPEHLFWVSVHILYNSPEHGKGSMSEHLIDHRERVFVSREKVSDWTEQHKTAGLMQTETTNSSVKFAMAEKVLAALMP